MKITDFVESQALEAELEFPEAGSGFFVRLRYLTPAERRRIASATMSKLVAKGDGTLGIDESEKELDIGMARLVQGWHGLTPELLNKLVPGFDVEACRTALGEAKEIACDPDNIFYLIRNVHGFMNFLERAAQAVENFKSKQLDAEIKN